MNNRIVSSLALGILAVLVAASAVAEPEVRLRDDSDVWDRDISLDLLDASVRQVLTLAFQIAEEPVLIDECVKGTVSLKFENVSLRDALTSIARMGDFIVRPRREGYFVGCSGSTGIAEFSEDAERIEFRLRSLGDGSVIAEPVLAVDYDSLAEIEIGSLVVEDLDDLGDFFPGELRPHLRIKVYLHDDEEHATDRLRGTMELAVRDTTGSRPTLRMAAQSFEVDLPGGSVDVALASLDVGGESYELSASRPAP